MLTQAQITDHLHINQVISSHHIRFILQQAFTKAWVQIIALITFGKLVSLKKKKISSDDTIGVGVCQLINVLIT